MQSCFDLTTIDSADCTPASFDASWRADSIVRPCAIGEVDVFIKAHYLGKRPAIVMLCLAMFFRGEPVGCVVFSAPPTQTEARYGGKTWELARLYLLDEMPRNSESWLIGKALKHIKREHRDVAYVVSYADPSAGHAGTIYRASNWIVDGRTDDERKTPRCDYTDARTGEKYGRRGNVPSSAQIVRIPRVSKWRFYYALRSSAPRSQVDPASPLAA